MKLFLLPHTRIMWVAWFVSKICWKARFEIIQKLLAFSSYQLDISNIYLSVCEWTWMFVLVSKQNKERSSHRRLGLKYVPASQGLMGIQGKVYYFSITLLTFGKISNIYFKFMILPNNCRLFEHFFRKNEKFPVKMIPIAFLVDWCFSRY